MRDDLDDDPHSAPLRLVTPHNPREKPHMRSLDRLAADLLAQHEILKSWRKAAQACDVLLKSGKPDPGLAQRIALHSYNPRRPETRSRLGLAPVCTNCGQKVKPARIVKVPRIRTVPAWVNQAVENLKKLEAEAQQKGEIRIYSRGGKRVPA